MQPYHFLAALPAVLSLAGFVLYQMLGANRAGDEITRRIIDKLRRDAPGETPDHRLSAKQVEHLLATRQKLQEVAGEQDFRLLQQALKQQFFTSLLVYVITIGFVAWSVYLFVHQSQAKTELSVKRIVLSDRQTEAKGLTVDLDPLTVTWDAEGDPEDVRVFLENVDTATRTDPKVASSSETTLSFEREEYSALLTRRQKGEVNRLRAVIQARKDAFRSEPTDVKVGFIMLTLADGTGVDVAAMIDNSRITFYSFEGKVLVPSRNTNQASISIGPTIPYAFQKVGVQPPGRYDWDGVKAVYFGPDDTRLVRYQYLIDGSLKAQPRSEPEPAALALIWKKNWLTINEPRPNMGSSAPLEKGGGSWTSREKLLSMLRALDLSTDVRLDKKRGALIALIDSSRTNPNDAVYNLQYTPEMRSIEGDLVRGIRNHAVESGVDVEKASRP